MFRKKQNCRATPVLSPQPQQQQKLKSSKCRCCYLHQSKYCIHMSRKIPCIKQFIFNPGASHELPLVVIKIQTHTYGKAGKTDFVFDLNTVTHKLILLLYEPNCTSTAKEKDEIIKFNSGIQNEEQRDKS